MTFSQDPHIKPPELNLGSQEVASLQNDGSQIAE